MGLQNLPPKVDTGFSAALGLQVTLLSPRVDLIQGILAWLRDVLWKQRSSQRFPDLVCVCHSSRFWFLLQLQFSLTPHLPCPLQSCKIAELSTSAVKEAWSSSGKMPCKTRPWQLQRFFFF